MLDTKCDLGVLTSKRQIEIDDPALAKLASDYTAAVKAHDTKKAASASAQLLAKRFRDLVKPGQVLVANDASHANIGDYPGKDKLAASVKWYAEAGALRVVADVTDASFDISAPDDKPWESASVEVFISPAGVNDTINQFILVPDGPANNARVKAIHTDKASAVKTSWKRTATGYVIDARIPYGLLRGYRKGWRVMPVAVAVNSKTSGGRTQVVMRRPGTPWNSVRSYVALKAK